MVNFRQMSRTYLGARSLNANRGAAVAAGQVVLPLMLPLYSRASAQADQAADYTRNSQPPLLNYQELVTLSEEETVDPALAAKVQTLLTTPFVNNEAYFNGTKPLRPDIKGMGPSLRRVEWNIERGVCNRSRFRHGPGYVRL